MKRKQVPKQSKETSRHQSPNYRVMLPFYNEQSESNLMLAVDYNESSEKVYLIPVKGHVSV